MLRPHLSHLMSVFNRNTSSPSHLEPHLSRSNSPHRSHPTGHLDGSPPSAAGAPSLHSIVLPINADHQAWGSADLKVARPFPWSVLQPLGSAHTIATPCTWPTRRLTSSTPTQIQASESIAWYRARIRG
ncbi:uncharacterized protein BO80DRAFT_111937 [Aspergillus ibericus CBS 121593]|uniref:Uncharacterized protein n=1 Tax=Aspergillus ibericus CBS 121593 TaxID=1448316 RepID=A0A395GY39_9EURO|nr:hypothetical protein BO80DRAFT_111937 [Aspergillus ibericus CBS 121593]RAK99994.1 hypothetical protein BO80DRAFT_111937 [Aspergillus ibericus CBS 121593]